jgi:carbon monoxide dehydrogenase subunit G
VELEHNFTVPASLADTWAAFNDPALVAPCFPGATLISVDGDDFTGSAKIKLGPIALQYNGTGSYVERDESAYRAVIEAKGKDKRGNGTANATITAELRVDGDGTAVHVTTDLAVTGKPAQFGRGVIQDVSDKLLQQFVTCLQATLGAPEAVPEWEDGARSASPERSAPSARSGQGGAVGEAQPTVSSPAVPGRATGPPTRAPVHRSVPPPAPAVDVELNLLGTIGHVLLTRYAARVLGPLAFLAGYLLGRRSRR